MILRFNFCGRLSSEPNLDLINQLDTDGNEIVSLRRVLPAALSTATTRLRCRL